MTKRLKAFLWGWKHQPSRARIRNIENHYSPLLNNSPDCPGIVLVDLIHVCRYADMGEMKAIKYAYALGFRDGMGGGM